MNEASPFSDPLQDPVTGKRRLPGSINVLTILTIIAVSIFTILSFVGYAFADTQYKRNEEILNSENYEKMPGFAKKFLNEDSVAFDKKMAENKLPILLINLIGLGLCLVGAIQMRKLMKQGFYLWLLGEVLPLIAMIALIGFSSISGFKFIGVLIAALFIFLYARQLKYMK